MLDLFHECLRTGTAYWYDTRQPPLRVLLQNFNKCFLNLGSRHTSMGMPPSPGALSSFICLREMLTSASEKVSVSMLRSHRLDQLDGWMFLYYL